MCLTHLEAAVDQESTEAEVALMRNAYHNPTLFPLSLRLKRPKLLRRLHRHRPSARPLQKKRTEFQGLLLRRCPYQYAGVSGGALDSHNSECA